MRSTSEVYMHIVDREFLSAERYRPQSASGPKRGRGTNRHLQGRSINWLKRSLEAVKQAHLAIRPEDLARKVRIENRDATVDGMYLRIIVHANEHMGQLIAYARMTGVVPPWSK